MLVFSIVIDVTELIDIIVDNFFPIAAFIGDIAAMASWWYVKCDRKKK